MGKYKYLLFDADNTLFDFDKSEDAAFRLALKDSALGYSKEVYGVYHVINEGLWKLLEKGGIERSVLRRERYRRLYEHFGVDGDEYIEVAEKYEHFLGQQTFEIDGVYDLLASLCGRYGMYIVTNGLTEIQESRFSKTRLSVFFKDIFISEKVGFAKPDSRYFDHVISVIGDRDLSDYLVIGDSLTSDIDGAVAYGIDCCWYNRKGALPDGRRPTYEISDITELTAVLG